jgi:carboxyl-terminal processing protease
MQLKWFKFIIILTTLIFIKSPTLINAQEAVQKNQLKFGRLLRLIDGYYVDSANVDALTEKAIVHLLGELDPHSVYISKDEVEKMNEPLKGNFEGIGISFNIFKDTLLVVSVIQGGPSEKAGLLAGDRIVVIDNQNVAGIGLKNSDVMNMLRGKKGTTVELKVFRNRMADLLGFTIIRDKIPINSLDASYMLDKSTGYIKLNKFSATTLDEFTNAMNDLKKENIKNLVLDLRGNGGGYLKTAIDITDQFLNNNQLIVYTSGLNEAKREYKSTADGIFREGNLVILVDETSASASEIVSGAVQDWDRGLIIGRRSFGKGLVQKPYFLTDGSMVRLTTAHYHTPSGRCIQKPYDKGVKEYKNDYLERLSHGELFSRDSIFFSDSLKYKTLVNDRPVFGGGGIMPDIFIPMDTSTHFSYYNMLRRNNIIHNFVLNYVDNNRESLKNKYSGFEKYNEKFQVSSDMIDKIIENGIKEGIEKNEESLSHTLDLMKKEVKALIAHDIFSRNSFYKIFYQDDEAIRKALEIINDKNQYNNLLVSSD